MQRAREKSLVFLLFVSKEEVKDVLTLLEGTAGLIVKVLYAGGLRISEAIRLRIQDVDFSF